eukprot:g18578.t1
MWSTALAATDVASSPSVTLSGGLEAIFVKHLCSVRDKQKHLLIANHFNSPSHSLDDMSIPGLLQCHNDTTRKLEEQHLTFRPGSLHPDGLNM